MEFDPRSYFELRLSVPDDRRYASLLRELAVHGAKEGGHSEADAAAFGSRVEQAANESLSAAPTPVAIPCTVRCAEGPVEVTIGSCCISTTR